MSVARHDIGASNAIEILNNPWMEMLQVSLVGTFWPIVGEVARAASHDIGSRCAIRSFWRNLGNVAKDPGHDIGATFAIEQVVNNYYLKMVRVLLAARLARNVRLKVSRSPGDVAKGASNDV